ncbi:MAG: hypothetical protein OXT65_01060 [Alphaproteobacteria bacterium]|nr:hypothetical protein [Alphaproteobacteria bacterium]
MKAYLNAGTILGMGFLFHMAAQPAIALVAGAVGGVYLYDAFSKRSKAASYKRALQGYDFWKTPPPSFMVSMGKCLSWALLAEAAYTFNHEIFLAKAVPAAFGMPLVLAGALMSSLAYMHEREKATKAIRLMAWQEGVLKNRPDMPQPGFAEKAFNKISGAMRHASRKAKKAVNLSLR